MANILSSPTPQTITPTMQGLRSTRRETRYGKPGETSVKPPSRYRAVINRMLTGSALCGLASMASVLWPGAVPDIATYSAGLALALLGAAMWRVQVALPANQDPIGERYVALADRLEKMEAAGWSMRESEDIHRSLTEAFGDVVIHRNAKGEITFVNSTARTLFDGQVSAPPVDRTTGRDGQTRIVRVQTPSGERVFRWGDLAMKDPITGEPGTRSFGRDITAERHDRSALENALHEVRAASHERDRVLAMVGHDLRTPASNISGFADWLSQTDLTKRQADYVDTIRTAARQQLDLVDDVLTEAAANRSSTALRPEPVDLRVLIEGVARTLAPRAEKADISIATRVAPNVATTVTIDGGRLRQVLINLAGNAIKFTKTGGVGIEVTADASGIDFSVTDSGPGIPEAERERIFDEFVRSEEVHETEGNGLGLAIAHNWIDAMDGKLVLADTEYGARFEAFIPLEKATRKAPTPPRRGIIGLHMNDDPSRQILANCLTDLGYTVHQTQDIETLRGCHAIIGQGDAPAGSPVPFIALRHVEDDDSKAKPRHWLTLPVRLSTLDMVVAEAAGTDVQRIRQRILLVEDDPVAATLTRRNLLAAGHRVSCVDTLVSAKSALTAAKFDVVLMDGTLPDGDGIEFIANLNLANDDSKPAMVVLSADSSAERTAQAKQAGAVALLAKPLNADVLDGLLHGPAETPALKTMDAPSLVPDNVVSLAPQKPGRPKLSVV